MARYNGYTVVTKATKEFIDASGRRKVKGNMDIELAVDAMELAGHIDQMILFSGEVISAPWLAQCNAAASASLSSPASQASRR